jgi:hypothetical protein
MTSRNFQPLRIGVFGPWGQGPIVRQWECGLPRRPSFSDFYVNTSTSQRYPFECTYDLTEQAVRWEARVRMPDGTTRFAQGNTEGDGVSPPELIAGNAVRQAVAVESFSDDAAR